MAELSALTLTYIKLSQNKFKRRPITRMCVIRDVPVLVIDNELEFVRRVAPWMSPQRAKRHSRISEYVTMHVIVLRFSILNQLIESVFCTNFQNSIPHVAILPLLPLTILKFWIELAEIQVRDVVKDHEPNFIGRTAHFVKCKYMPLLNEHKKKKGKK